MEMAKQIKILEWKNLFLKLKINIYIYYWKTFTVFHSMINCCHLKELKRNSSS